MKTGLLLKILFIVMSISMILVWSPVFKQYCNILFDSHITYPLTFGIGATPKNNDGGTFYDQGDFSILVSGIHSTVNNIFKDGVRDQSEEFDRTAYKVAKKTALFSPAAAKTIFSISKPKPIVVETISICATLSI